MRGGDLRKSILFGAGSKRFESDPAPAREALVRAVISAQRLRMLAIAAVAWRRSRRREGEKPELPLAAVALLTVDLTTGYLAETRVLRTVLNGLRARAIDEGAEGLSDDDLRSVALQIYCQPKNAVRLLGGRRPGLGEVAARMFVRSLVGGAARAEEAMRAADTVNLR